MRCKVHGAIGVARILFIMLVCDRNGVDRIVVVNTGSFRSIMAMPARRFAAPFVTRPSKTGPEIVVRI